jgi:pimeloyl-ACP methyl ester carboxylesterase
VLVISMLVWLRWGWRPALLALAAIDEGDVVVPGSFVMARMLRDPEAAKVPAALDAAYRQRNGRVERSDLMVVEPSLPPRGALIFLHGFGGSFALECWLMAQPDLVTFCPSVGWRGDWWNHARTLDETLALARRRGFSQVYLAGLSNGGAGAARLAAHRGFRGLVLVSGTAAAPAPGIPVLVVQGRRDRMASVESAREYAARTGADYVELSGGHFALLLDAKARVAIADWLRRH